MFKKKLLGGIVLVSTAAILVAGCAQAQPAATPKPAPATTVAPAPATKAPSPTTAAPVPKAATPTTTAPAPTPTPQKVTLLRIADGRPPTGVNPEDLVKFTKEVERRTNGRVKFEIYWGESLLKMKEILKGVQTRASDLGYVSNGYHTSELPLSQLISSVMFGTRDVVKQAEAVIKLYETIPAFQAEAAKYNQRLIGFYLYDLSELYSKKAVRTLADFKGVKVRVSSKEMGEAYAAVGAVPAFMSSADTYEALQKGMVDAGAIALESGMMRSWHEVTKYVVLVDSLTPFLASLTINLDVLNSLPKDVQDIIIEEGRNHSMRCIQALSAGFEDNKKKLQAKGLELIPLPQADLETWANMPAAKNIPLAWAKGVEAKGFPGTDLLNQYMKLMGVK